MKNNNYFLISFFPFLIFIFFIGCATKSEPIFVTIKSPKIKVSDSGFLEKGINYKKLIIYKAGTKPIEIILKENRICFNKKCFNKYLFLKNYFGIEDKNFFDTILDKKMFKNVKIKKIKNGFIQKSKFFYKVTKNSILFKKKGLIIYIKFLKEKND